MSTDGRRPRILLDALPFHPEDGGFSKALLDLLEACSALDDFDFTVACARDQAHSLKRFGLRVVSVPLPRRARYLTSAAVLPAIAARLRCDAIHCEISASPLVVGVARSVTVHDLYALTAPESLPGGVASWPIRAYMTRYFKAALRRSDLVKAISAATACELRELISIALPIRVIQPHCPQPAPVARVWPRGGEPLRLLAVGSIVPRRNVGFLLEAVKRVGRPYTLDVVGKHMWGENPLGNPGDERIVWHGYVPPTRLAELMSSSHVFVSASHNEGFGYPLVEAMANGLPVLCSAIPAYQEVAPDGALFPLTDPSVLAARIDALTAGDLARMSVLSVQRSESLARQDYKEAHRAFFSELVASSAVSGG